MSLFPEEQLDSPVGYFTGQPGQTLENGTWSIMRKVGWGPRSSSWLAIDTDDPDEIEVIKIFTVSATQEPSAKEELKLLRNTIKTQIGSGALDFVDHFYEESPKGKHLCMVIRPLGSSIEALRLSDPESGGTLPLYAVQKVICDILSPLCELDGLKIVHGAITPDNFLFESVGAAKDIMEDLAPFPCAPVEQITGKDGKVYPVIISQPMPHRAKWNDTREVFADETIVLSNFGHARRANGIVSLDAAPNLLPPEALLGGKVDTKTNIWMLACTAYFLLTGTPLFSLSYAESPVEKLAETLSTLEDGLVANDKLSPKDIALTASFLRLCLALDPCERPTAFELYNNKWVQGGATCSCGWCAAD
ncbi:kinase-like domain-containing protein [Flammula alnicola]|nr:kinase-like domain-containing protein [Flammula alnicola]